MKPRRLEITLQIQGRTWRRITLEVSADEGHAAERADLFPSPSLAHFGLHLPATTAGIAIDYQVAQKLHACSDLHTTERPNDRVRDVVDLQLLKVAFYTENATSSSLASACRDLFEARAREAASTGEVAVRAWPPTVVAHPHWQADYPTYAQETGLGLSLAEAVTDLNTWIAEIERGVSRLGLG